MEMMAMKLKSLFVAALVAMAATAANAQMDQKMGMTKMVGGAEMFPSKTIVANAVNSKDHTTLVAAVQAAGLVDTLNSAGPFTVFAPTNAAFDKLPTGTVDNLLKPENKATLTKILTYHVAAGKWDSAAIMKGIKAGKGTFEFPTVAGGKLWASEEKMGGKNMIVITDEKGGKAWVTIADVNQSNGVIHVINAVLMPN
jgi:uncharacterized surface protein with fasciclin (FAS1) repeats